MLFFSNIWVLLLKYQFYLAGFVVIFDLNNKPFFENVSLKTKIIKDKIQFDSMFFSKYFLFHVKYV